MLAWPSLATFFANSIFCCMTAFLWWYSLDFCRCLRRSSFDQCRPVFISDIASSSVVMPHLSLSSLFFLSLIIFDLIGRLVTYRVPSERRLTTHSMLEPSLVTLSLDVQCAERLITLSLVRVELLDCSNNTFC